MEIEKWLKKKFQKVLELLDEKQRRLIAAVDAQMLGRGGIAIVSRASGLSKISITKGIAELQSGKRTGTDRIRIPGGGRKKVEEKLPELKEEIEKLVAPSTRGDPESPLLWTCKSTREISQTLEQKGLQIGYRTVARLLGDLGFSLQGNAKTLEGTTHPDRDAQFNLINGLVKKRISLEEPVISVDTKKKELVGKYRNGGKEWMPKGNPEKVNVHDFIDKTSGKAIPYGIYDIGKNLGWVNVGADHDTAAFAVESIRRWWYGMGAVLYSKKKRLLICADGGGSNGYRLRLWKVELQKLANELDMEISVCHFPPGTSKWNKIEHRLFSHISMNWRGRPLVSHEVVVELISTTKTRNGLIVKAEIDSNEYPLKIKVSKDEMESVRLKKKKFHGEWNYSILPNLEKKSATIG